MKVWRGGYRPLGLRLVLMARRYVWLSMVAVSLAIWGGMLGFIVWWVW